MLIFGHVIKLYKYGNDSYRTSKLSLSFKKVVFFLLSFKHQLLSQQALFFDSFN